MDQGPPGSRRAGAESVIGSNSGTVPIFAERKWDCPLPKPGSYLSATPCPVQNVPKRIVNHLGGIRRFAILVWIPAPVLESLYVDR